MLAASSSVGGAALADGAPRSADTMACRDRSAPMAKVELYFGAARGGRNAWTRFLADVVTPRFPDGLTSWDVSGQWRGKRGLEREAAHAIVIFYRSDATSDERIEAIRATYERRFKQTSVLRADSSACVGF